MRTDQGPEFTCRALDQLTFERGVKLRLIQPGKPAQNGFIVNLNACFAMNVLMNTGFAILSMQCGFLTQPPRL
uniref:Insertion element IS407 uncharacterized 31.7 kDa protein ORF1 n=1 Tax=Erwinia amylovora ATCC BAA-2158 TaxID=889211 RepID=E5B2B8_ERWAM|nr:Insertion element IS407 uncharacterized 31.7 kDa protein ORF1 [Erwinia amylovora ATCC BAA-2158]